MRRCDVLIVGGGPAGSSCAAGLRRAGLDAVVVDRARFPRDKVCAGWITPAVVSALGLDLADYAHGRTLQVITGFRTGAIGHREVSTNYDEPVSYAIRRCEFDHYLLQRAGVDVVPGAAVRVLERVNGAWRAGGAEAPLVVGAGGHFCPVARALNPDERRAGGPVVAAQEIEFAMTAAERVACRVEPRMPELHFCADRRGYGWCVRKGDFLNVGFGCVGGEGFHERARVFREFLASRGRVPPGLPDAWNGHAYRLYARPRRRLVGEAALLVGDAAGLAHPVSGEGILPAVESGLLAARAIVDARGDYSADRLSEYARAVAARYGAPAAWREHPGPVPAVTSWIAVRLLSAGWFARHVLLDRWFLHARASPLEGCAPGPCPVATTPA